MKVDRTSLMFLRVIPCRGDPIKLSAAEGFGMRSSVCRNSCDRRKRPGQLDPSNNRQQSADAELYFISISTICPSELPAFVSV